MADFPQSNLVNPVGGVIHTFSACALMDILTARKVSNMGFTSGVWTTANRAIFIPFTVETTVTAYQMAVFNGATVNGNLDVGIYGLNGDRLVSIGSTAQSGASVIQKFNITDTVLTPGYYFLAMATDSTTATYFGSISTSGVGEYFRSLGVREQLSAFPLPDPATFANPAATTDKVPSICVAINSVI